MPTTPSAGTRSAIARRRIRTRRCGAFDPPPPHFPPRRRSRQQRGTCIQSWEDWPNALAAFDQALALLPSHPDALLGRIISLSQLERHQDAIAAATQLIDEGRWHLGQAFYWRAWNYFNIGQNDAARAVLTVPRRLMVNPAVFLLSGMIEWRFLRREPTESEFQEALKMDFGQCDAAFYLGGVRAELRKLPEALAAMSQARQCYDLTLSVRRKLLVESQARAGTLEQKAREAARHERSIANVEKRRAEVLEAIDRLQKIQAAAVPLAPTSRQSPRSVTVSRVASRMCLSAISRPCCMTRRMRARYSTLNRPNAFSIRKRPSVLILLSGTG